MLQLVGTDHCAWNSTQKAKGIDDFRILLNGVNGESKIVQSPSFFTCSTWKCESLSSHLQV